MIRQANRPGRSRLSQRFRQRAVGDGPAEGNLAKLRPDALLESRSSEQDRRREAPTLAAEIFIELADGRPQRFGGPPRSVFRRTADKNSEARPSSVPVTSIQPIGDR